MARKKTSLVVGVFSTVARAEEAVAALKKARFKADDISLVARDADGKMVHGKLEANRTEEGAVAGALAGAGTGALVGVGMLAGLVPVAGPFLAAGALGTLLLNTAGGAAVVGLAGGLIGYGVSEEEATFLEGEVQAGRYLVTVNAGGKRAEAVRCIFQQFGGYQKARPPEAPSPEGNGSAHVPAPEGKRPCVKGCAH